MGNDPKFMGMPCLFILNPWVTHLDTNAFKLVSGMLIGESARNFVNLVWTTTITQKFKNGGFMPNHVHPSLDFFTIAW